MTLLDETSRADLWAELMRDLSRERETIALTKPELRAAVDAVDQWIEDNQASFNAALPAAARAGLTTKQKVKLFFYVAQKRFKVF